MKGLMLKDLYVMKKYARTTALVALVFAAVGLMSANNASFAGMISMMSTMMIVNAFSYDDLAKWDRYALSMPISRKTMVGARFLLGLILWAGGLVLALAIMMLSMAIHGQTAFLESLLVVVIIGAGMLMAMSIAVPLLYKFGVEKGRMLMLLAFLPPVAIAMIPLWLYGDSAVSYLIALFPLLSLAMYAGAYWMSVKIVRKKDY